MWSFLDNIDYSNESIIKFLSGVFKISEQLIIDYCEKFNFPYTEADMHKIFENVELTNQYFDLCENISYDISSKDHEKIYSILSHYQFPETKIVEYLPNNIPVLGSISSYMESVSLIYNKLKNNQKLTEDDYYDIDIVLDGPREFYLRIPTDRRMTIINGLDDGYKEHYFKKNIEKLLKKYDNNDIYVPRLNGVPLVDTRLFLSKEKVEEFFASNYEKVSDILSPYEQTALITLINSIPYMHSFLLPENIKKRVLELDNIEKNNNILNDLTNWCDEIKIEIFKNHETGKKTDDSEKYHLSEDFIKEIIDKIPNEYSDLEKTMYVYYMLCYILTYDNYYFKNNRRENNTMRSSMIKISKENNEVVCYQFASALKDILTALGIRTSKLYYSKLDSEKFVNSHQELQIYVDGVVLEADSTRKGADSDDLTFFKMGKVGDGIRCEMYSSNLREQFFNAKNKVVQKITEDLNIKYYQEIEEDLRAFKNVYGDDKDESKKVAFIFYEMSKLSLSRVDSIALFSELYNRIFDDYEKKEITCEYQTTDKEWSVNIRIGDINFHYDFDTKSIEYNSLSHIRR